VSFSVYCIEEENLGEKMKNCKTLTIKVHSLHEKEIIEKKNYRRHLLRSYST